MPVESYNNLFIENIYRMNSNQYMYLKKKKNRSTVIHVF